MEEAALSDGVDEPSELRDVRDADEIAPPQATEQHNHAEPSAAAEGTADHEPIHEVGAFEDVEAVEVLERHRATLLPVRRSVALVPRRRDLSEMTLGEVAAAAKKLAPAAIAGAAAAAIVTFFRRR